MKVSFIVPCRNKEKFVGRTVETVLAQTYSPMEIILSDQGSVDDTFQIIKSLADNYTGPNTVRVLQCPDLEYRGMAGLNKHLNWLHTQMDGDVVIMCSADDLNHPERVEHTVEAFKRHNPSYVGTGVQYMNDDCVFRGEITAFAVNITEDCWVDPVRNIQELIGSSASSAWSRDLWDKYAPMRDIESQDVLLPVMATMERGLFYVNKYLHAYIRHADINNTGLEGVMRASQKMLNEAKTIEEKIIATSSLNADTETINYHVTSNMYAILRRITEMNIKVQPDLYNAIISKALECANVWSLARDQLTMSRVSPKEMKV